MRPRHALSLLALAALPVVAGCDTTTRTAAAIDVYVTEVTFDVTRATLGGNNTVLSQQFSIPSLSSNVTQSGAVLAYFWDQNTWTAMPYTYAVDDPQKQAVSYTVSLGHAFSAQTFEVFYETSASDVDLRQQPTRRIKLVLLGPGLAYKTGVDHSNYEAVRQAYNLPS